MPPQAIPACCSRRSAAPRPTEEIDAHLALALRGAAVARPRRQREGRALDFKALVEFSRDAAYGRGTFFIEGVGGIMVPLDETHTVLDWMSALRIPVLLVAGSYLGTISHTLTALHVLAQRNLDIAAVVVSESAAPGASLDDTVATIARFAVPIEVIGLPRLLPGTAPERSVLTRIERLF